MEAALYAGRARDRVTFQVETQTDDGGGGYALAWVDALTVSGEYRPERGRERVEAGRLETSMAGTLRVRWSSESRAITTAHRVLIDGEAYQIRSIENEDRRNRDLVMVVERGVAT